MADSETKVVIIRRSNMFEQGILRFGRESWGGEKCCFGGGEVSRKANPGIEVKQGGAEDRVAAN